MALPQYPLCFGPSMGKLLGIALILLSQGDLGFLACLLGELWLEYALHYPCSMNLLRRIARIQRTMPSNQNFHLLNVSKFVGRFFLSCLKVLVVVSTLP